MGTYIIIKLSGKDPRPCRHITHSTNAEIKYPREVESPLCIEEFDIVNYFSVWNTH